MMSLNGTTMVNVIFTLILEYIKIPDNYFRIYNT